LHSCVVMCVNHVVCDILTTCILIYYVIVLGLMFDFYHQAFPIQLVDAGKLSLFSLTNERSYLRTADEDDGISATNEQQENPESSRNELKLYSYTLTDLKHLVQYARDRGIAVIPEVDMPAHTL
jgi:hypothetical protein